MGSPGRGEAWLMDTLQSYIKHVDMASEPKKSRQYEKRVLVTGGAGFIGSHMVIHLVKKYPNYYVVNFDKLDYCASLRNLKEIEDSPNYKFIKGDICDSPLVRQVFKDEEINTVMHFAAQTHVDNSFWSSLEFNHTNVYGTQVILNAACEVGVDRFIHISSDEVYGGNSTVEMDETVPMQPTNPYAGTKAAAECVVLAYWQSYKLPVIVTRSNNAYGPHQYPEKVIPKFVSLLERNRKCVVYGDGSPIRNYIYVTDLAEAYDVILHKGTPGDIYNIGTESQISALDLAKYLVREVKQVQSDEDVMKYIEFVEDRPFHDRMYPLTWNKVRNLGWAPKTTFEEGIRQTVKWYQNEDNFNNWDQAEKALKSFNFSETKPQKGLNRALLSLP